MKEKQLMRLEIQQSFLGVNNWQGLLIGDKKEKGQTVP